MNTWSVIAELLKNTEDNLTAISSNSGIITMYSITEPNFRKNYFSKYQDNNEIIYTYMHALVYLV
jgi:hypothetical protein